MNRFNPHVIQAAGLSGESRGREDAFKRARRCLGYLDQVLPLRDTSLIPSTSLLREFIGGSIYT